MLGIPAHPLAPDVVRAIGVSGAARAALDALLPTTRLRHGATLGSVVRARMGDRVVTRLVNPVVRGVYSASADDLGLRDALPPLADALGRTRRLAVAARRLRAAAPAGSQVAGIEGGMARLTDALATAARAHGAQIHLGERVTDPLALPGTVVIAAAGFVGGQQTVRTVTVAACAVQGLDGAPRGTGVLVDPDATGVKARALTHSSAKWDWLSHGELALLRLSYDGESAPSREVVQRDVRILTGVSGAVVTDVVLRTWRRTVAVAGPDPTFAVVGEASGRSGLASIIPHARQVAADLAAHPAAPRKGQP